MCITPSYTWLLWFGISFIQNIYDVNIAKGRRENAPFYIKYEYERKCKYSRSKCYRVWVVPAIAFSLCVYTENRNGIHKSQRCNNSELSWFKKKAEYQPYDLPYTTPFILWIKKITSTYIWYIITGFLKIKKKEKHMKVASSLTLEDPPAYHTYIFSIATVSRLVCGSGQQQLPYIRGQNYYICSWCYLTKCAVRAVHLPTIGTSVLNEIEIS